MGVDSTLQARLMPPGFTDLMPQKDLETHRTKLATHYSRESSTDSLSLFKGLIGSVPLSMARVVPSSFPSSMVAVATRTIMNYSFMVSVLVDIESHFCRLLCHTSITFPILPSIWVFPLLDHSAYWTVSSLHSSCCHQSSQCKQ